MSEGFLKLLVEQVYRSLYRQQFKMHTKGVFHAISHKNEEHAIGNCTK